MTSGRVVFAMGDRSPLNLSAGGDSFVGLNEDQKGIEKWNWLGILHFWNQMVDLDICVSPYGWQN